MEYVQSEVTRKFEKNQKKDIPKFFKKNLENFYNQKLFKIS